MKENAQSRAKERACDKAIKKTLAYSAVFKYPMSFFQLGTYLISKHRFDYETFDGSLKRLVKKKHIKVAKGKYFSSGIKPVSWEKRAKDSKTIVKENTWAIKLLATIPWLEMAAVTGSVAAFNAEADDDIDLFIITRPNRLWLTRGFTALILSIAGKYARNKNSKKKLCCNIFIDENNLKWPEGQNNLFVAHDILNMHPFVNRDDTYFKFIKANRWALKYFGNFNADLSKPSGISGSKKKKGNWIGNRLDNIAMQAQLKYMKKKKTTEITKKGFLHFNKHDHTHTVLENYNRLIGNI